MRRRAPLTRRTFLGAGAAAAGLASVPYWSAAASAAEESKNDRPIVAAIGCGGRGMKIAQDAARHGDMVAVCEVDRKRGEQAVARFGGKAELYGDYRRVLDRNDVEAVTIGTPDHWHAPIALAALAAGKDVYCEKPLTLTIHEGQLLCDAVRRTGRVFQVGTQQRSSKLFRGACELVRNGRLGKLHTVTVTLPFSTKTGGPFAPQTAPPELDWDMWQGQAPAHDYCPERCHYTFRWWYEYSGGIMTDWGAHHMDIAHWAMDSERTGPITIEGQASLPAIANGYNTPAKFSVAMRYPNDVTLNIQIGDNGILFEGDQGRIYVNRGRLTGKPVEDLADHPLGDEAIRVYASDNHMGNFFECLKTRKQPISDVFSHHRSVSACHLANISMRLGRKLSWDAANERFVGDAEADGMLRREPRKGYEFG